MDQLVEILSDLSITPRTPKETGKTGMDDKVNRLTMRYGYQVGFQFY